jgi:hypothetical protein
MEQKVLEPLGQQFEQLGQQEHSSNLKLWLFDLYLDYTGGIHPQLSQVAHKVAHRVNLIGHTLGMVRMD